MGVDATCAVCGRTILAGERVGRYVAGEQRQSVCELCVARAERLGWRLEGAPGPDRAEGRERGGHGRLSGLLRGRARRPGAPPPEPAAATPRPKAVLPDTDPAAPGRRQRLPADAEVPSPAERAVARFNAGEPGRTVAGLTRTLGQPCVSVGASARASEEVRITVAWELSWYQWGVDLADELRPVFQLGKGGEIDELDSAAREWNAGVGEDGRIVLGRPAAHSTGSQGR
ncbi:MAG TPA: hypothetical protein VFJ99_01705 [Solirubrobacterales bacterium]|nr:hypothetical protein [Solirubrobacterales bacterium]